MTDQALVIARYGQKCLLELQDGSRSQAHLRSRARTVVCGDRVELVVDSAALVVEAVLPRRNEFPRADRRGRRQVIAANVDRVIIVIAPAPAPTRDLLNRYLVACASVGVDAAICLNKVDRLGEETAPAFEVLARRYEGLGYPFLNTCAKRADGLTDLEAMLSGGVHILVGQSGVGKSSLIDRLLPDRELETNALSRSTGKGRHTTTSTTLYRLPRGGAIMDSPGVWEYGIWKMEPWEIAAGFREFVPYVDQCRFGDCTHRSEPSCAVRAAVEGRAIAPERYDSYLRILRVA